jgi:hypothetical protein
MRSKTKSEIMSKPHWAIVRNVTTHHPGDERSRTHPGHGYPAHDTVEAVYEPYETEVEVLDKVRTKQSHERFVVIKAQPLTIETTISLKTGDQFR